ncbi:MAG: cytidylate kinase-like family protein [Alphaproteobacteria bacterium]|nr:cytidylate kinase-like family protein [Alphaproteobacteria bacterium]
MARATHQPISDKEQWRPESPVVTLSRDYGSGGDEIAGMLSERLGVPLYDMVILEEIAKRLEADEAVLRRIDEHISTVRDLWLLNVITGHHVDLSSYRRTLVNVVLMVARMGGVIVGRGAHVILSTACALRIRVAGSPDVCAKRVMALEGISEAAALAKIRNVNSNRGRFVWEMFHVRHNDPTQFDITLNTDRMVDMIPCVEMLMTMARAIYAGDVVQNNARVPM